MKKDVTVIKFFHRYGKLLGATSSWKNGDYNRKWIMVQKVYIFFLLLSTVAGSILSIISRGYGFWTESAMSQVITEFIECIIELSLLLSIFLGALKHVNRWKEIFMTLRKIDGSLSTENFDPSLSHCWYSSKILFCHFIFVLIHGYDLLTWVSKEEPESEHGYILYRIVTYYQFFISVFAVSLIRMLQKRFTFLENLLRDILAKRYLIISQVGEENTLLKLAKIRNVYGMLGKIVRNFDIIFGYTIFFGTVTNVIVALRDLNYIVTYGDTNDTEFNIQIVATNTAYAGLYFLSTIAIVMSCDGVEKTGDNIVTICYLSHHVVEKSPIREDIISFADYAEHLAPHFSAAGFFQINQRILSSLFSAVITYFIIIIQFNSAI